MSGLTDLYDVYITVLSSVSLEWTLLTDITVLSILSFWMNMTNLCYSAQ